MSAIPSAWKSSIVDVGVRGHVQALAGFEPERVVEVLGRQDRVAVAAGLEDRRGVERAAADDRRGSSWPCRRGEGQQRDDGEREPHVAPLRPRTTAAANPSSRPAIATPRITSQPDRARRRRPAAGVAVGAARRAWASGSAWRARPASRTSPTGSPGREELDAELERDRLASRSAAVERDAELVAPPSTTSGGAHALGLHACRARSRDWPPFSRPDSRATSLAGRVEQLGPQRRAAAGLVAPGSRSPRRARAGPRAPRSSTSAPRPGAIVSWKSPAPSPAPAPARRPPCDLGPGRLVGAVGAREQRGELVAELVGVLDVDVGAAADARDALAAAGARAR